MGIADGFIERLKEAGEQQRASALKATDVFAEYVLGVAQKRAPVGGGEFSPNDPAPGTLAASATKEPAVMDGSTVRVVIGFNTVYAAVQHENTEFRHEEPGQSKYLESAMRENASRFGPFVSDEMKKASE